ncbi:MAG: response regulator [Puia sp.]|nr:response regulator [Puia sp.]
MSNYHKLLAKQASRLLPEELAGHPALLKFLALVSNTYQSFERDKKISEHAFSVSEKEYQEVTLHLQQQIQIRHQSILKLKKVIRSLDRNDQEPPDIEFPCKDPDEDLIGVISFLEEQIRKTKTLETELILAKEAAEKAARAKSDFLSVMSHEIRTPLNAITGLSHLLMEEEHYPHQTENMTALRLSADNLLHLINDILDFGKIEEGKIVFSEKDMDLRRLVTNIKMANRIHADERGNKIELILDNELPPFVRGDDMRLGQVLNNLISNAVKFTQNGQITVEVLLNKVNESTVTIDFSVTDTGIGIEKGKQELIFERFAQANSEITREFGGSGLGLSIVKRLLNLQNSDIYVDSEAGSGSRFFFSLNFKKTALCRQEHSLPLFGERADLKGLKILLVEDVEFNVLVAEKMLSKWNARVATASNGLKALGKLKEDNFDIVLMDLQMPVMDGYTATTHIREFDKTTPIIALTASTSMEIQQKAFDCGMTDYLSKPFNPNDLLNTILKYAR